MWLKNTIPWTALLRLRSALRLPPSFYPLERPGSIFTSDLYPTFLIFSPRSPLSSICIRTWVLCFHSTTASLANLLCGFSTTLNPKHSKRIQSAPTGHPAIVLRPLEPMFLLQPPQICLSSSNDCLLSAVGIATFPFVSYHSLHSVHHHSL